MPNNVEKRELIAKVVILLSLLFKGEGVAYRGRLLVELESKLGEEIDKELETMAPAELVRVQVGDLSFVSPAAQDTQAAFLRSTNM